MIFGSLLSWGERAGGPGPAIWAAEDDSSGGGGEAPPPAPPPAADPPPAAGDDGAPAASAAAQALPAAEPPQRDWRELRIARLTGQLREAQEKLKAVGTTPAPAAPPPATVSEAVINQRANELATLMEAQRSFNSRCEATVAAGRAAFPDFNAKVDALKQILDPSDTALMGQYNQLLDAAIETGEGARIIHQLGSDPNEAARLLALPPLKMALEVAKIAQKRGVELSAAPRPLTPVNPAASRGNEKIEPDDSARADKLDTATWMRRREEQVKQRASA